MEHEREENADDDRHHEIAAARDLERTVRTDAGTRGSHPLATGVETSVLTDGIQRRERGQRGDDSDEQLNQRLAVHAAVTLCTATSDAKEPTTENAPPWRVGRHRPPRIDRDLHEASSSDRR